jgi:hypothetical protein
MTYLIVVPKSAVALVCKAFACGVDGSKNQNNPKKCVPNTSIGYG